MNNTLSLYNIIILSLFLSFNMMRTPFCSAALLRTTFVKTTPVTKISRNISVENSSQFSASNFSNGKPSADIAACCTDTISKNTLPITRQLANLENIISYSDSVSTIERKPRLQTEIQSINLRPLAAGTTLPAQTDGVQVLGLLVDPKNSSVFYTLEVIPRSDKPYRPEGLILKRYISNPDSKGHLQGEILQRWNTQQALDLAGIDRKKAIELGLWSESANQPLDGQMFRTNYFDNSLFLADDGKIGIAFARGMVVSSDQGKTFRKVKGLEEYSVLSYRYEKNRKVLLVNENTGNGKRKFSLIHQEKNRKAIKLELPRFYSSIGEGDNSPTLVRSHPKNSKTVYVGTGKRVFECNTYPNCSQSSWKEMGFDRVGGGMHWDSTVYDISFDETNMYAATCNGVYYKPLSGGNWRKITSPVFNSGITEQSIAARTEKGINVSRYLRAETITINPNQKNQRVIASEGRVFYSNDSGINWTRLNIPDGSNGDKQNSHFYDFTQFLADGSILVGGGKSYYSKDAPLYRVMP